MTSLIVSSPPKYNSCDEISKISTLFFHNSHTPQPPIQFWYSPWNVLLSHLNVELANDERTLNVRWTHVEWMVCERRTEFGEQRVNSERWANAERKRSAKASAKWTVNAQWTQDERSIRKAFCVFFRTKYLIIPR